MSNKAHLVQMDNWLNIPINLLPAILDNSQQLIEIKLIVQ